MKPHIPEDISIETLLNFIKGRKEIKLKGSHSRNAYQDILEYEIDENGDSRLSVCQDSLYDLLPETLFHPVDRYENIPANEYKERFDEEWASQQKEEQNARKFFEPFDTFLIGLRSIVDDLKQEELSNQKVLNGIICDHLPDKYSDNRFVKKAFPFIPACRMIRGNHTLITLMLRKIFFEEGLYIEAKEILEESIDSYPKYNCNLDSNDPVTYLGNLFEDNVKTYVIKYWSEEDCNQDFLLFVKEMEIFSEFIMDYFMSIEEKLKFEISTYTLPVRISDDKYFNYLNYNTNI